MTVPRQAQAAAQLAEWGLTPHRWSKKLNARHEFTHIRWEMTGYVLEVQGDGPAGWRWADEAGRKMLAVPSAFARMTEELETTVKERE